MGTLRAAADGGDLIPAGERNGLAAEVPERRMLAEPVLFTKGPNF